MKLMALIYFVLSLFGMDIGSSNFVHRTIEDGIDVLYSKARAQAGVAHFACLRSASGKCHYTVLPRDCAANPAGACLADPIKRFVLAQGEERLIPGLQGFGLCVSPDAANSEPDCGPPRKIATR